MFTKFGTRYILGQVAPSLRPRWTILHSNPLPLPFVWLILYVYLMAEINKLKNNHQAAEGWILCLKMFTVVNELQATWHGKTDAKLCILKIRLTESSACCNHVSGTISLARSLYVNYRSLDTYLRISHFCLKHFQARTGGFICLVLEDNSLFLTRTNR